MFNIKKQSSAAVRFLATYFLLCVSILSLAFFYYTKQILQLNRDLEAQVESLASLAAEIPELSDNRLQNRLNQIVKQSIQMGRLSFVITDANDQQVIIAKGVEPEIERKLSAEPPIALTVEERHQLDTTLERMRKRDHSRPIQYLVEDREIYGYLYHGISDPTAIEQIPFVFTDANQKPQKWQRWGGLITATSSTLDQSVQAEMLIRSATAQNYVVPLQTTPTWQKGYFYYEKKPYYGLISMPIVLAVVFISFSVVGFLSYRRIKTYEQTAIWTGLAKETAHQLGTPISSLIGWVEHISSRGNEKLDPVLYETCNNMQKDLNRLQQITRRFSKIGSMPQKSLVDVNLIVSEVVLYFQDRLPKSRKISIDIDYGGLPKIQANAELLQWVFENLIRNSVDAINKPVGHIHLSLNYDSENRLISIIYGDNGRGIPRKDQRKIFAPGMTTKKHGWGLGLTLAKRIIEQYHHGQIRLLSTDASGTTFEIQIPILQPEEPISSERLA